MPGKTQPAQDKNYVQAINDDANDERHRLEIDEFCCDNRMTNLYLLALEDMQKEDPSKFGDKEDWWTFYSLGAIHGAPYDDHWAGVPKEEPGYCAHGKSTFPTWHRVYINMWEQAVANKMMKIAEQYTDPGDRKSYIAAAQRFRAPYWDPLMPRAKIEEAEWPKNREMDDDSKEIWDVPWILRQEIVHVYRPHVPKGKDPNKREDHMEEIPNPLFSFKFPETNILKEKGRKCLDWEGINKKAGAKFHQETTTRAPRDAENELSDVCEFRKRLREQNKNLSTKLWKLLSKYSPDQIPDPKNVDALNDQFRTWDLFANHQVWYDRPKILKDLKDKMEKEGKKWPEGMPISEDIDEATDTFTAISVESWHDAIHNLVGGGQGEHPKWAGHMSNPRIAGFDPIFWLHHCNIDRLLAIFQALYENTWLDDNTAAKDLYPFIKAFNSAEQKNEYWQSKDVANWMIQGYAVPGNKKFKLHSEGMLALQRYLNVYYDWAAQATYPSKRVWALWPKNTKETLFALTGELKHLDRAKETVELEVMRDEKFFHRKIHLPDFRIEDTPLDDTVPAKPIQPGKSIPSEIIDGNQTETWNARVRVKKFAFDGSFNVHLFIGRVNDQHAVNFMTRPNEVGYTGVFANSASGCDNCQKQKDEGLIYQDTIPISPALVNYLKSVDPATPDKPENVREDDYLQLKTLDDFSKDSVASLLKDHLQWRVTDAASNVISDPQSIKDSGLEIRVSHRGYVLPTDDAPLGIYLPISWVDDITKGKLGGYGYVG